MVGLIVLGSCVLILLDIVIANQFRGIAEMKGHKEMKYFWFCVIFGVIGYMMVIALPDISTRTVRVEPERSKPASVEKKPSPKNNDDDDRLPTL